MNPHQRVLLFLQIDSMAVQRLNITSFLELAQQHLVLDVRSPGEFNQAHIPGAKNLPLFTDEERKVVGTAYKQQSREIAIKVGLDYFGTKMRAMVEQVEVWLAEREKETTKADKTVLVHCWRGGMRSAGVAWLLELYGFKVYSLVGGYKKFRHWVIDSFRVPYAFRILGGYTGSGKSYVLRTLGERGASIVDLEGIASHKGSAFGNIGLPPQPSQEMFENILAWQLRKQTGLLFADLTHPETLRIPETIIWLEDESQRIGLVNIPQPLWNHMRQCPVYFLDIPFDERLIHITAEYGPLDKQKMADAIQRIQKRLGPLETKTALQHLAANEIADCFRILLKYYDKWYLKGLQNRENLNALLKNLPAECVAHEANATIVLSAN